MTPGRELPPFLVDSGEMGELIAARDWSATPLGPMAGWDAGLKAMVSMMLAAERPVALLCGEMGTLVYNKGYAEICGTRHPAVLGKGVLEAWPEAADFNGNVLATCLAGGKLTYKDTHLVLQRNGTPRIPGSTSTTAHSAMRKGASSASWRWSRRPRRITMPARRCAPRRSASASPSMPPA